MRRILIWTIVCVGKVRVCSSLEWESDGILGSGSILLFGQKPRLDLKIINIITDHLLG